MTLWMMIMILGAGLMQGAGQQPEELPPAGTEQAVDSGNWVLVQHGEHATLVIHGRQAPPMEGLPVVVPGAYVVAGKPAPKEPSERYEKAPSAEEVRRAARVAWQDRRRAAVAQRHNAEPRDVFPLWKYTPKRDWSYTPAQRSGYKPISRSNYTPQRSFRYSPRS